jgi:hypothetical protein
VHDDLVAVEARAGDRSASATEAGVQRRLGDERDRVRTELGGVRTLGVVTEAEAKTVFFSRHGKVVARDPSAAELASDPLQAHIDGTRSRGVEPDWRSGMPEYRHDRDVPWELEAATWEALERDEPWKWTGRSGLPVDGA